MIEIRYSNGVVEYEEYSYPRYLDFTRDQPLDNIWLNISPFLVSIRVDLEHDNTESITLS